MSMAPFEALTASCSRWVGAFVRPISFMDKTSQQVCCGVEPAAPASLAPAPALGGPVFRRWRRHGRDGGFDGRLGRLARLSTIGLAIRSRRLAVTVGQRP